MAMPSGVHANFNGFITSANGKSSAHGLDLSDNGISTMLLFLHAVPQEEQLDGYSLFGRPEAGHLVWKGVADVHALVVERDAGVGLEREADLHTNVSTDLTSHSMRPAWCLSGRLNRSIRNSVPTSMFAGV